MQTGHVVPSAFAEATVLSLDGSPVRLGSLWAEGPTVIAWVRHFG